MKIRELDPKELPFYHKSNLHEYDTQKKGYVRENTHNFAEVAYYASLGAEDHLFLVTTRAQRYEVRLRAGEVVSIGQVDTKARSDGDALLEALVKDYAGKTEWLNNRDVGTYMSRVDGLMVRYGKPVTEYEPPFKRESKFYDVYEETPL